MANTSTSHNTAIVKEYTSRASDYESSNRGWHAELADDFITWIQPTPGSTVLDLACGTGLVTFRIAEAIGPSGTVIGVDITPAMLAVANNKLKSQSTSSNTSTTTATSHIHFIEADITSPSALTNHPAINDILTKQGGFDIITCCSALILLDNPSEAIDLWSRLLKPDVGRLILDVPTERYTVQYLATEILGARLNVPFPFSRAWVKDSQSLGDVMRQTGRLEVVRSFATRSYLPERMVGGKEGWLGKEVWEELVLGRFARVYRDMGVEMEMEAKREWERLWDEVVGRDDGVFADGHWLYVCVGRRLGSERMRE